MATRHLKTSGVPSKILEQFTEILAPGQALDLGCAKGDDVVWLAKQGWQVLGVDISKAALDIASEMLPETECRIVSRSNSTICPEASRWVPSILFQPFSCKPRSTFRARKFCRPLHRWCGHPGFC